MIRRALMALVIPAALAAPGAIPPPRDPAPPFKARSIDGATFSNASLRGRIVLLQFWTTWCGYCRRDELAVEQLTREFTGRGLVVLAVNVGESRRTVEAYLAKSRRSPKIVLMPDTNLAALFQPRGFPLYVVIDRDGKLAGSQNGAGGGEPLREMLRQAGLN